MTAAQQVARFIQAIQWVIVKAVKLLCWGRGRGMAAFQTISNQKTHFMVFFPFSAFIFYIYFYSDWILGEKNHTPIVCVKGEYIHAVHFAAAIKHNFLLERRRMPFMLKWEAKTFPPSPVQLVLLSWCVWAATGTAEHLKWVEKENNLRWAEHLKWGNGSPLFKRGDTQMLLL